jgi:hypothetical protein
VAFDLDFEFPGFLWSPELRYPVHFLPPEVGEGMTRWLDDRNVKLLAVGPAHAAMLAPQWQKRFDCSSSDCAVYVRRPKEK